MTTLSNNWNVSLKDAFSAEIKAMVQGSFKLVSVAAMIYVENVYRTVPAVKADATTEYLHDAMQVLNYGKSSKYALANAALSIARDWIKRFGKPTIGTELNVFWATLYAHETLDEAIVWAASTIAHDYGADMKAVYASFAKPSAGKPDDKTIAEKVAAALGKVSVTEASDAIAKNAGFLLGEDRIAAIAAIVAQLDADALGKVMDMANARLMHFNEVQADLDAPELKAA